MFKLPLTKLAIGGMMMPPASATPTPAPAPMPAPQAPTPMPQAPVMAHGSSGPSGNSAVPPQSLTPAPARPAPGAGNAAGAFKPMAKVAFVSVPYPPIQQQRPRTGLINATVDTGKDFMDGFGQYSLDVLNENSRKTQRPNDPRVMARTGGLSV